MAVSERLQAFLLTAAGQAGGNVAVSHCSSRETNRYAHCQTLGLDETWLSNLQRWKTRPNCGEIGLGYDKVTVVDKIMKGTMLR
ncbi:hypothetical protein RvY_12587 [Ramazzottius varieornatus]|uniref:Uncharacterized protein n=1 Tax=Ramazzottius varieornatus TaxID=947166 RepID=A0A1D1VK02_RAMVA|nr:hypothetical protein RvY_12587 [Ramazzottius varieornatus]